MSADAEPSPQQILVLIEKVKGQKLPYIYYEDLAAPRLAETIASETGAGLLKLSNGQDVSKKDIQSGVSFISLMARNLENLKKGMQCP
jgi:zinc transport system substrate-binding protein